MAQDARDSTQQSSITNPTHSSDSSLEPDSQRTARARSGTLASSPSLPLSTRPRNSATEDPSAGHWSSPPVRTLPGWIRSVEIPEDEPDALSRLLPPSEVDDALVAQHNHSPYDKSRPDRSDEIDDAAGIGESRWTRFAKSVQYPRSQEPTQEKRVSWDWLNQNLGDYSQPWGVSNDGSDMEQAGRRATWQGRRRHWIVRFQNNLLRKPLVPLIFRLTVWLFSLCALALGGSIHRLSERYGSPQGPSADMAIIVDAVALVYLVYITYDEYTGKPLGLRSPKAKMRLVLLDIFFIVFDSANLSLAFASLSDVRGACTNATINDRLDKKNDAICDRQTALASVLLIALIAWLLTFSISAFRLVERVSSK